MFGRRWFGGAWFGAAYWGDGGDIQAVPTVRRYVARAQQDQFKAGASQTVFVAKAPNDTFSGGQP